MAQNRQFRSNSICVGRFSSVQGWLLGLIFACAALPSVALAEVVCEWDKATNLIYDPSGAQVGYVANGGLALSTLPQTAGQSVLAQPPGCTHLVSSDDPNERYIVQANGTLIPEGQEEDDQGNTGIIGGLLGNTGNSGNAGNSGNSGNSGNCGSSGCGNSGNSGNSGNGSPPPAPPAPEAPPAPAGMQLDSSKDPGNAEFLCSRIVEFSGGDFGCGSGGGGGVTRETNKDYRTGRDIKNSVKDITTTQAKNNLANGLIEAFEGWQQYYAGVERSPVTIDSRPISISYPNNVTAKQDSKRPQLGPAYGQKEDLKLPSLNIGTDDEVLKTSMSIYQPISRMQMDFLEDTFARDRYLESALTLRGIAIMTMGFLDKTVGAGLTAVQQQADMNTVQQLLKQISWTSSKIANPTRAQLYRDTDEKLEACMEIALTKKVAKADIKKTTREVVEFTCSPKCGPQPTKKNDYRTENGKKSGNGSYAYCVCCAETADELQKLRTGGQTADAGKKRWSVVERVFYGTKDLQSAGAASGPGLSDVAGKVEKMVRVFKEMYGDILLVHKDDTDGGIGGVDLGAAATGEPYFRYVYIFPKYSVQRRIAALRNGCYYCGDGVCDVTQKGDACPLQEIDLKYGICPAISYIFENWGKIIKEHAKPDAETVRAWIEASMGHAISGRSVKTMLSLTGNDTEESVKPNGPLKRFIDSWCDASAVAAFTRYHTRLSSIIEDHMMLNRQVTEQDKAMLSGLVSRVSSQLSLSQADEASNYQVEAQLTGLGVQHDRENASVQSAAVSANISGQASSVARAGEVSGYGYVAEHFSGGGASAARDINVGREAADPLSATLSAID